MPLSEDEQRILSQIEANFYENDPKFAEEVRQASVYRHASRFVRLGLLMAVVGLAVMIASFSTNIYLAFAGFVLLFAGAYLTVVKLRLIGKASLNDLSYAIRHGQLSEGGDGVGPLHHRFRRRRRTTDDGSSD